MSNWKAVALNLKKLLKHSFQQHFIESKLALLSLTYLSLSVMLSAFNLVLGRALVSILALKLSQPWGIVTSPLVHEDLRHLLGNYIGIIISHVMLMLLLACNIIADTFKHEVFIKYKTLGRLYGTTILISGTIIPGAATYIALYMLENPKTQIIGASGIHYALLGYTIPLTIATTYNAAQLYLQNPKQGKKLLITLTPIIASTTITLTYYIHKPLEFLVYQPGVNTLAHLTGFTAGVIISAVFLTIYILKYTIRIYAGKSRL